MKNVYIFGVILLGLFVLMFIFSNLAKESFDLPDEAPMPGEVWENEWIKGNPESEVILVEYSDFECPACASYYPLFDQIVETYKDRILLVYRHFPLTEIHPNAHLAARVSEAAGNQGKFWEMHDLLFEKQNEWRGRNASSIFENYAQELGLDIVKFNDDLRSKEVIEKVQIGVLSGMRADVPGTPTLYLNGERINPRSYEELASLIENKLK